LRSLRTPDQLRRRERYHPSSSLKRVKIGRRSWVKFGSRLTPIIEGCGPVTARYCDPDGNKLDRPPVGLPEGGHRGTPMKNIVCAVATATAVLSSALLAGPAGAEATQLAQVDVQVGPPPVRVEPEPRPGVVIEEERRRPGVVIGGPEGRPRDCTTRSQSETRNGVTVTEKKRECTR
jgi:hypothetical protein